MEKTTDLIFFNSSDGKVSLPVAIKSETVWLTLDQIAALFQRDKSTISRHIRNVFQENELERSATVAKFATVQEEGSRQVEREIPEQYLEWICSNYRRGLIPKETINKALKYFDTDVNELNLRVDVRSKEEESLEDLLGRITE